MYYGINEDKSTEREHFFIPPSHFSVHLQRRTSNEPLTSDSIPRIEIEAKLESLELDVSREVLTYSHQLVEYFKSQSSTSQRPRLRPLKQ